MIEFLKLPALIQLVINFGCVWLGYSVARALEIKRFQREHLLSGRLRKALLDLLTEAYDQLPWQERLRLGEKEGDAIDDYLKASQTLWKIKEDHCEGLKP